jgi:hypothetical protein
VQASENGTQPGNLLSGAVDQQGLFVNGAAAAHEV